MAIKLSTEFLTKLAQLSKSEQKRTRRTMDAMNLDQKGNGIQMHRLDKDNCDESFWSARVSDDIRIILSKQGDNLFFLYVDHHDQAYSWASNKVFTQNQMGSCYVYDNEPTFSVNKLSSATRSENGLLMNVGLKSKHLVRLGISEIHASIIIQIDDEDILLEYISFLPDEIEEAIIDLATGAKSYQEVIDELNYTDDDFDLADDPNSRRRFVDVNDLDKYDLDELLNNFSEWKLFLHPRQQRIVYANANGPMLIEGGPGTGKTIVGVHRALHLSKDVYQAGQIYFVTFNKTLPLIIDGMVKELEKVQQIETDVKVTNVDKLFRKILSKNGFSYSDYKPKQMREALNMLHEKYGKKICTLDFLINEYFEVIQKYHITSLDEYFDVERKGRGKGLSKPVRERIWNLISKILQYKEDHAIYDFEDRAAKLITLVEEGIVDPFIDSLIIDEAQDLSVLKLKTLYKLVKNKKNNVMILSDQNQRIYSMSSWKKETSLKVVGRTFYLTLNYRTTREIKSFAEDNYRNHTLIERYEKEYKSILSGPEPIEKQLETLPECYEYLISVVKKMLLNFHPGEIAIITTYEYIDRVLGVLEANSFSTVKFSEIEILSELVDKINLVPLELAKGLEYRAVILFDIPDENPKLGFLDDLDEYYYTKEYQKYECLKYVASTRARDYLFDIRKEN